MQSWRQDWASQDPRELFSHVSRVSVPSLEHYLGFSTAWKSYQNWDCLGVGGLSVLRLASRLWHLVLLWQPADRSCCVRKALASEWKGRARAEEKTVVWGSLPFQWYVPRSSTFQKESSLGGRGLGGGATDLISNKERLYTFFKDVFKATLETRELSMCPVFLVLLSESSAEWPDYRELAIN